MEGLNKDDELYIPLSEDITISLNSSDEFAITESDLESKSVYLSYEEDIPGEERGNLSGEIEKEINFQNVMGNKRESNNLSPSLRSQYFPNSILNLMNEENTQNKNTYSELNYGYTELDKIMSKYTFFDAAKIILKINNGILEDNGDNHELYQQLKKISSVIKNKNNLTLMCLGILSSKIQFKKDEERENKVAKENNLNKKEKDKEDKIDKVGNINISNIFQIMERKCKKKYIYGNHYYKTHNKIYCYKNRSLIPRRYATLFCEKRKICGCDAKVLVNSDPNDILLFGRHRHEGMPNNDFYKQFSRFKNKNWNHIQFIRKGSEENIMYYN